MVDGVWAELSKLADTVPEGKKAEIVTNLAHTLLRVFHISLPTHTLSRVFYISLTLVPTHTLSHAFYISLTLVPTHTLSHAFYISLTLVPCFFIPSLHIPIDNESLRK